MVALKLKLPGENDQIVGGEKQERRGGIETIDLPCIEAKALDEAGTPWWH